MTPPPHPLLPRLPAVDELLRRPRVAEQATAHGTGIVTRAVREVIEAARRRLTRGSPATEADLAEWTGDAAVLAAVQRVLAPSLRPVVNATGVVLHTNLGRAPMPPFAEVTGYASVELDLATGRRGARGAEVEVHLAALVGCEAAVAVNNGAAAVMLVLRAIAAGREVLVSRGELVEIGGGFRVPEVLAESGARLVEVGTTNKTRLADYRRAAGPETAAILVVHRSNFRVEGFTAAPRLADLAALGRDLGVPVVHDLGSGLLTPELATGPLAGEPTVAGALSAGADLVCFSGDKLLGGPQSGLVAGRGALVDTVRRHPLFRALRCDKVTLAALAETLRLHRDGRSRDVPVHRMLAATVPDLAAHAEAMCEHLAAAGVPAHVVVVEDAVGGGAAPGAALPGAAVALPTADPDALAARLREGDPAVVALVREGEVRLHLRTVVGEVDLVDLVEAVARAARVQ